ncbi:MAG: SDR family NAD(P)-dependent oxidoreductase [Chloroflexota bacterium]
MKLAIITGASRGLGQALFEQLGNLGYQRIDLSRSAPYEESRQIDLTSPEQAHKVIQATLADIDAGTIEELLVINNAATNEPIGPPATHDASSIITHLNINVVSQILFLSAVMAKFRETACPKMIANISSGAANFAFEGFSVYCAAKAGLEQFVRTVAAEQQREPAPFTLVNINPGVMDTDMQTLMRDQTAADFPAVDHFINMKKVGQLATPAQVAAGIIKIVTMDTVVSGERYSAQEF